MPEPIVTPTLSEPIQEQEKEPNEDSSSQPIQDQQEDQQQEPTVVSSDPSQPTVVINPSNLSQEPNEDLSSQPTVVSSESSQHIQEKEQEQKPITLPEISKELTENIEKQIKDFKSSDNDPDVIKIKNSVQKVQTELKEIEKMFKPVISSIPQKKEEQVPQEPLSPEEEEQKGGRKPCAQFSVCLDDIYLYPIHDEPIYYDITAYILIYKKLIGQQIINKKYIKFDEFVNSIPLTTLEHKIEKMNELNNLYKPLQLTIVENTETQEDYNYLFGNNKNCDNIFYKLPLPFCLTINQITQIFQEMYLTQFTVFEEMMNDYNLFQYEVIGENKKIYIEFPNKKRIQIKPSSFYELNLPNVDFTIKNIHIDIPTRQYNYEYKLNTALYATPTTIPLKNINKEDLVAPQKITQLNTMYKLGDKEVLIENYYYYFDVLCTVGTQIKYINQIHLLKEFEKDENIKNIENFILIEYIFPDEVVNSLWELYKNQYLLYNGTDLDEMKIYYESKSETTNEILVLIERKINPRRFFSLLLYISRIYNEKFPSHWIGSMYYEINLSLGDDFYKKPDYIDRFIAVTFSVLGYMIQNYTIFFCKDVLYNNIINGKFISSISNGELFGGGIEELINPITKFFRKTTSKLEDFTSEMVSKVGNYKEFIVGESNITIDKKVLKWVTNVDLDHAEPDVIDFISNYITQPSITDDLLNKKSRENVCKEIAELQNSIDGIFSDLKLLLPKNYFDSEIYMDKYLENAEKK